MATVADLEAAHNRALALIRSMVPYGSTIDVETLNDLRALVAAIFSVLEINHALANVQVELTIAAFRTAYLLGWRDGQAERTTARLLDS